jgi:hypothetical protein
MFCCKENETKNRFVIEMDNCSGVIKSPGFVVKKRKTLQLTYDNSRSRLLAFYVQTKHEHLSGRQNQLFNQYTFEMGAETA